MRSIANGLTFAIVLLAAGSVTAQADSLPETDPINQDSVMALAAPGIRVGWSWPVARFALVDSSIAAKFYVKKWVEPGKKREEWKTLGERLSEIRGVWRGDAPTHDGFSAGLARYAAERKPADWYKLEPPQAVRHALPGVEFYLTGDEFVDYGPRTGVRTYRQFVAAYRGCFYHVAGCFQELLRDTGMRFTERDAPGWARAYVVLDAVWRELTRLQGAEDWGGRGLRWMLVARADPKPLLTRTDTLESYYGVRARQFSLPGGEVVELRGSRMWSRSVDVQTRADVVTVLADSVRRRPHVTVLEIGRETDDAGRMWVYPGEGPEILDRLRTEPGTEAESEN